MGGVNPARGFGDTLFRDVRCKDCLREQLELQRDGSDLVDEQDAIRFEYSESWANKTIDRGGSRTDRCARHRKAHRQAIQGIAVAYVDLETIGEVADRENPTGPLGGLGELPDSHRPKPVSVDLSKRQFGMTDDHVREALRLLSNDQTRVLVLKAGTGTGKSTFGPYRLMNPPTGMPGDDDLIRLTKLGPIVVTEPRVQATTGVARFVGEKLVAGCKWKECSLHGRFVPAKDADPDDPEGPDHPGEITDDCVVADCVRHIGPGYPVGYQVKDDKKHDDSCQLIYVTDGTMVNWLREGRLSKIGTVIVDEAHERSINIDYIMGELARQIDRYPHLRVVVTSATFDVDFYVSFFGGPTRVAQLNVPAEKAFGYGAPFFPLVDTVPECGCEPQPSGGRRHPLGDPTDAASWLRTHWPEQQPRVGDVVAGDMWMITEQLERFRYAGPAIDLDKFGAGTADLVADATVKQITSMVNGFDGLGISGDILAFLPTERLITAAVLAVKGAVDAKKNDVYGLIGTMDKALQDEALAPRPPGSRRKVVIATNLAETSLTVEGVRFVVDGGIINQETWDPSAASGRVIIQAHSQAGIRQRWGRVGRDSPGWVFPLYTKASFEKLPRNTAPQSTRASHERLIMTAKAGGVDNIQDFPWPALHDDGKLDRSGKDSIEAFRAENSRALRAIELAGILDGPDGDLTKFGNELVRFTAGSSASTGLAIMLADQLACVPEVVTALSLLELNNLEGPRNTVFISDPTWPAALRAEVQMRRVASYVGCRDDLDFVLRIAAGWDHADPGAPPWEATTARIEWSKMWWINHETLKTLAESRRETLSSLSPAMKEEVKRFIDVRLAQRARAVLSHALTSLHYVRNADGNYTSVADPDLPPAKLHVRASSVAREPERVIALKRERNPRTDTVAIRHVVEVLAWATEERLDAFRLLELAAVQASPRRIVHGGADSLLPYITSWPVGERARLRIETKSDALYATIEERYAGQPPPIKQDADEVQQLPTQRESNWLLGQPQADEELLTRLPTDTADNPLDREKGSETNDDEEVLELVDAAQPVDLLAGWRPPATALTLSTSRVQLLSDEPAPERLDATIVGYTIEVDGGPTVQITSVFMAAQLEVPDDSPRRVFGGEARAAEIRALHGILACNFDGPHGPMYLVATSQTALNVAIDHARGRPSRVTGSMTMPTTGAWGKLMGKGGSDARQRRETSGVNSAHCNKGDLAWELAGPDEQSLRKYVELANRDVPGCRLDIDASRGPRVIVRDLVSGQEVEDWRTADFTVVPAREWPLVSPTLSSEVDSGVSGAAVTDGVLRTDDDLRTVVAALRAGEPATVNIRDSTVLRTDLLLAFISGLASAQPDTAIDNSEDTHLVLRPGPTSALSVAKSGNVRHFEFSALDDSAQSAALAAALGDTVVIDASSATSTEFESLMAFFSGAAAILGATLRTKDPCLITLN